MEPANTAVRARRGTVHPLRRVVHEQVPQEVFEVLAERDRVGEPGQHPRDRQEVVNSARFLLSLWVARLQ